MNVLVLSSSSSLEEWEFAGWLMEARDGKERTEAGCSSIYRQRTRLAEDELLINGWMDGGERCEIEQTQASD